MKCRIEFKNNFKMKMLIFSTIGIVISLFSCKENENSGNGKSPLEYSELIIIGIDVSKTLKGYRKIDSSFVHDVCRVIEGQGGGIVAFYTIGDLNDRAGLRCYIKKVPVEDPDLTLSRKIDHKLFIDSIKGGNRIAIAKFLNEVQAEIDLARGKDGSQNTAIVQFFGKAEKLLNEPQLQDPKRYVFLYSDGINSVNKKEFPAKYEFQTDKKFTLCLSGWKSDYPSNGVETISFENPIGFVEFLNKNN
jgi:hypothetical protein